ncbi:MAG TPA: hypothetical protein VE987_05285, partial [Polyangiaceae bacterium]|nr:hypothetical protein [Polyangiaceae bacterium]
SSGGSSSGAAADAGAGDGSTALCATKIVVAPSNPVLNDFEAYTGATAFLASTPFGPAYPNGGYTGPYAYSGGGPQLNEAGTNYVLSMVTGQTGGTLEGGAQDWALDLTVTDESGFGAGLGFWMTCANASAFRGLSFWVRGQTPTGAVAVQLQTADTTSTTASQPGTCTGTCAHPSATVLGDAAIPVGPSWTQITLPWAAFTGGTRNGAAYTPTGDNLTGLVFTTGLVYTQVDAAADGAAIYGPTPANIDLQIDDVAFVP